MPTHAMFVTVLDILHPQLLQPNVPSHELCAAVSVPSLACKASHSDLSSAL
jgi:hypothetical protein